jgi:hypothetical protein
MGGWNIARLPVVLIESDWFGKDWEGIEQVFRLERTGRILKTPHIRHEVVSGRQPPLAAASSTRTPPPTDQSPLGHRKSSALEA